MKKKNNNYTFREKLYAELGGCDIGREEKMILSLSLTDLIIKELGVEIEAWMDVHQSKNRTFTTKELIKYVEKQLNQ